VDLKANTTGCVWKIKNFYENMDRKEITRASAALACAATCQVRKELFLDSVTSEKRTSCGILNSRLCTAFTSSCALSSAQVLKNKYLKEPLPKEVKGQNYSRAVARHG